MSIPNAGSGGARNPLLLKTYAALDYGSGALLRAVEQPQPYTAEADQWVNAGEWLALAKRAGADRLFFVDNDPVLIFSEVADSHPAAALRAYRKSWCMARPRLLFLALPDELRVYGLHSPPVRSTEEWQDISPIRTVSKAADVLKVLGDLSRDRIEQQDFPGDVHFGEHGRADWQLVQDLKTIRHRLLGAALNLRATHALIGAAIFIRYLEDRGVLTAEYFRSAKALVRSQSRSNFRPDFSERHSLFIDCLQNRAGTERLFHKLLVDFNGDIFPEVTEHFTRIQQVHLDLLRSLLLGESDPDQPKLFLWAYDFEVVPIELISTIYEEFYHTDPAADDRGTHYTPSYLVEDVLARVLTAEVLDEEPRVLDPACGSGVFLVEAYRRIVRHRMLREQRALTGRELRQILRDQLVGIDIDESAVRVAALSLYLALLHYQRPPDIVRKKRLPGLVAGLQPESSEDSYDILHATDSFGVTKEDRREATCRLKNRHRFRGKAALEEWLQSAPTLRVSLSSVDVVVGNPPWSRAKADSHALKWAEGRQLRVGDSSLPQLFVWRALDFLRPGCSAGLLLHANVIFNQRQTTRNFRKAWLRKATLRMVLNFAHVRTLVFARGVAPFIFVYFQAKKPPSSSTLAYVSARHTLAAERVRESMLLSADRRLVHQGQVTDYDYLWKTYWWGSHRDAALVAALGAELRLRDIVKSEPSPGYGFQYGSRRPSETLRSLRPISSNALEPFGPLREEWFEEPPTGVKRDPPRSLYEGQRLIVVRGVKSGGTGPYVRVETKAFSFRHTIYGVPMCGVPEWLAMVILGMFWSSLGKYRLFMTSGSWGPWYDSVVPDDILNMPIPSRSKQDATTRRVVDLVYQLRAWETADPVPATILEELDDAIFKLFGLSAAEQDLVRDFFNFEFDLFTNGPTAEALHPVPVDVGSRQGTLSTVRESGIESYLIPFLESWNGELNGSGEFVWQVIENRPGGLRALILRPTEHPASMMSEHVRSWPGVLDRLEQYANRLGLGRIEYGKRSVKIVTEKEIIIVKKDQRRLWSASAAREDVEATKLRAIQLQES